MKVKGWIMVEMGCLRTIALVRLKSDRWMKEESSSKLFIVLSSGTQFRSSTPFQLFPSLQPFLDRIYNINSQKTKLAKNTTYLHLAYKKSYSALTLDHSIR